MNNRTPALARQGILVYICMGFALPVQIVLADGGIVTDGTMGAAQTLRGANITIAQSLGTTVGGNLFHSFSEFNIAHGQTVEFTGSDTLQNVISRVTGADVTNIEGSLKSSIANAAFYFINPNGITFGADAQVDVPGAFHVSTADRISFPNHDGAFYADSRRASTLSSEAPAAFGFLNSSAANNALITVDGAQLELRTGQTLDMVAGGITVENDADLIAPAGEIRLVAVQDAGSVSLQKTGNGALPLPSAHPALSHAGHLTVKSSAIDTTGDGGGRIALWAGNASFADSTVFADNNGAMNAAPAKAVDINTASLSVDNTRITFDALSFGKAGPVTVESGGSLAIVNGGNIGSSTYAEGDAGNVSVTADSLMINSRGGTLWPTGILSRAELFSSGKAGNVSVQAETLDILKGGEVSSLTFSQGDAGRVKVTADKLTINSLAFSSLPTGIFSQAVDGSGHAGKLSVRAGTLDILNGGRISSSTFSQGNASNVRVTADTLRINGQDNLSLTGIFSQANDGSGRAGKLLVRAGTLDIVNGGAVSSSTFTQGDAGKVSVTADKLTINSGGFSLLPTGIFSQAADGSGQAGNVSVRAGILDILDGGRISSSTFAQGNAGDVSVQADALRINGQGDSSSVTGILSQAVDGDGSAGNVIVRAGTLDILNRGSVSSSTFTQGKAGTVTVNSGTVAVLGGGNISSASIGADSGGNTGNVIVTVGEKLRLADGGLISIENQAKLSDSDAAFIHPGALIINAADIAMQDSDITSNSTGNVAAGNIALNFSHCLTMDSSYITTTANAGNGGSITINGGELATLHNSGFTTTVTGANSNGGDIFTSADRLVMDSGLIQANAVGGSGGNITLNLKALIPSGNSLILGGTPVNWRPSIFGFNVIQAASQAGVSGAVNVTAPQLNLSGILANLGGPQFDTGKIGADYCGAGTGSSLTRNGSGGLKPKSADLHY